MKLYCTSYFLTPVETNLSPVQHREFSSSQADASKVRTRLKALTKNDIDCDFSHIETKEIDINPTRSELIKVMNEYMAHSSWAVQPVADAIHG